MSSNEIVYNAFVAKRDSVVYQLKTLSVLISGSYCMNDVTSLWDTGATGSCISREVVKQLNLMPVGFKQIKTPSGSSVVNTYLVSIVLANNVTIVDVEVCESDIGEQGIDLLIGMDIISMGDFSVSNFNGKTVFTFRTPSKETTDYVREIAIEKLVGNKHGKGKRKK